MHPLVNASINNFRQSLSPAHQDIKNTKVARNQKTSKTVNMDSYLSNDEEDDSLVITYHTILSILLAVLAISTNRFRYLWIPHMCILGAWGICDSNWWNWILSYTLKEVKRLNVLLCRHIILAVVLALLIKSVSISDIDI